MNIILIDSDCKKYFSDENAVRQRLGDPKCRVYQWNPNEPMEVEDHCRCILISAMSSGVKKQHRDLFQKYTNVSSWVITVVDVSLKGEQNQLTDNLDSILTNCKIPYTLVFEKSELYQTAQLCKQPVKQKKTCLIRSCNEQLADKLAQMLALRLRDWNITINEDDYDGANAIVLAGSSVKDYQIPAPKYGMGRAYVWIAQNYPRRKRIRSEVCSELENRGWSLHNPARIFESDLMLESYAYRLETGDIDCTTLANDEHFVLCDMYGLPLLSRDYTKEQIDDTLNSFCCFARMSEQF